ncbi:MULTISPECIES: plasmid mobilization protein [Burkholderia]|uniref:plasmid mobilization protein n=1 Tax=Burkholderia TaxID=32008 RepID=UPI0035B548CF
MLCEASQLPPITINNERLDGDVPRRRNQPIRVWCLQEEKAQIEANARDAGLSVSRYLRNVGMGCKIEGVIDANLVLQLAKINGDQGRLGGLLKLWLTNSGQLGSQDPENLRRVIHGVLDRITTMQGG